MIRTVSVASAATVMLVALGVAPAVASVPAPWVSAASMSPPRTQLGVATGPGGQIYAVGGSAAGVALKRVDAYDPGADHWTPATDLTEARAMPALALGNNGPLYALGGRDGQGTPLASVEAVSGSGGPVVPSLPTARYALGAATGRDGKIYAVGGYATGDQVTGAVEAYDPGATPPAWTSLSQTITPRAGLAVVAVNGLIYAIGGRTGTDAASTSNLVEAYNPAIPSDPWTTRRPMRTPRYGAAAAVGPDGRIYVVGGEDANGAALKTVAAYTPATDSWATGPDMVTARAWLGAATAPNGHVHAIGGQNSTGDSPANEYLPEQIPPNGRVVINSGAASTSSSTVSLAVLAGDSSGVTSVRLSNSPVMSGGLLTPASTRTYSSPISWNLADTATGGNNALGVHTVYVQWKDSVGNWSDVASDTIKLTGTPPTITSPPKPRLVTPAKVGTTPADSDLPATVSWKASPGSRSAICSYSLQRSRNGGAFTNVALSDPTATTASDILPARGDTYLYSVRATGCDGATSASSGGSPFGYKLIPESSAQVTYGGVWTRTACSKCTDGTMTSTKALGATAVIKVANAYAVAVVSDIGPTQGAVKVYVDGSLVDTVTTYASAASYRQLVFTANWGLPASHTIKLVNQATAGHPSFDLDSEVLLYAP